MSLYLIHPCLRYNSPFVCLGLGAGGISMLWKPISSNLENISSIFDALGFVLLLAMYKTKTATKTKNDVSISKNLVADIAYYLRRKTNIIDNKQHKL